jgi:hypothetical protein
MEAFIDSGMSLINTAGKLLSSFITLETAALVRLTKMHIHS